MTQQLSPNQLRLLRRRAQHLHPEAAESISNPAQLIRQLCGLQSQELPAAHLAVRVRSQGLVSNDVKQAREVERSIVLTWMMRGTMHLLSAEDVAWLLPFFGPIFTQKSQRRYKQLGLDEEDTRKRAAQIMQDILRVRGPMIRTELAEVLNIKGIPVAGQAIFYLLRSAALEGVICFGPEKEGELSYVVLEDWIGREINSNFDTNDLLPELARRYLMAYNPASPDDFARWAGISLKQARAGFDAIADDLMEVEVMGSSASMLKQNLAWLDTPHDEPIVHLLPRYDTYLLGHTSRDFMVDEAFAKRVHPGGGQIQQTVISDGYAIGIWRTKRKKNSLIVIFEPFKSIPSEIIPHLETEVQDMGRFLAQETKLVI